MPRESHFEFVAELRLENPLSLKYNTDDQFWFTFFHEAGHLLLHGDRLFIESENMASNKEEQEANIFSGDILVPPEQRESLRTIPVNQFAVARFARMLGISAGVLVGQLQHYKRIRPNQLNGLKRYYRWKD